MRESLVIGLGGLKRVLRFFFTGKICDLCQNLKKKITEHSKGVAPLSSQKITLKFRLIRAVAQGTPSFATATTDTCDQQLDPDRILMKFDYQHKIVGIPDCLVPLTAINDDVRVREFCNN